jgi:DDE superfamily endonuclease
VLKGEPALVDSTSPRRGEQASSYSAVCLESGNVEVMELVGNSNAETSTAFLKHLRAKYGGPAHGGDAIREHLATPDLNLRLVRLPADCPDFNADEKVWGSVREDVTANTCLGTTAAVQEKVGACFAGLAGRTAQVQRRCRTELQAQAELLLTHVTETLHDASHVEPIGALVLASSRRMASMTTRR